MDVQRLVDQVNDPHSVAHGVVSSTLAAGLALIEPRRLTTGGRLAYRGAWAALSVWMVGASLRPDDDADLDLLGPVRRAALAVAAGGMTLGLSEAGEAVDGRLHDLLVRAGAGRPRVWLAAAEAAFSMATWWMHRRENRIPHGLGDIDLSEWPVLDPSRV
ncbi:MAG: hypothetical protein ACK5LS_10450 [Propioniciclava sp.]